MSNEKNPFLIQYTVGLNYIEPAVRQKIGVAGNHNAVELEFDIDTKLKETLESVTGDGHDGGGIRFRFDVYNAVGEVFRTESELLENVDTIRYQLQERDTRYGGVVKVVLVLTAFDGAEVTKEVFCPPAQLQLLGAQYGANKYSYTELEQKALNAAERATTAANETLVIKEAYDKGELNGKDGEDGKDYILTEEDKEEISALVPTHEKYFQIEEATENGCIISLKPEYRGAVNKQATVNDAIFDPTKIPCAISDNNVGKVGSKNYELPSEIYIPLTVNGVAVEGLMRGTFAYNERIKRVILHPNIKELKGYTFCRTINLEEIECIEQITTISTYEFAFTRLKRVELPNLIKGNTYIFMNCPLLEYVDIGNIPKISNLAFCNNCNLKEIKIAAPVPEVGNQAFWRCYNLRTVDNIIAPNITTSIGNGAFFLCKPTYDWDALAQSGCTFGNHATSNQVHANKFWLQEDGTPIPFTPCENKPIPSLAQDDVRWQTTVFNPENGDTFMTSCEGMCVMGAWCALNNINIDDARDYLDICKRYGTDFKDINYGIYDVKGDSTNPITIFYSKMNLKPNGYSAAGWGRLDQARTNLQSVYQALADGKYVVFTVPNNLNDGRGHVVVVTGVTPTGELIIQDTSNAGWPLGLQGSVIGRIPIQNLINTVKITAGIQGVALSKKAVT